MVPNTSELLPDPETPVNTVSRRFGSSTLTSLRLFSRAPCTRIQSWLSATGSADDWLPVFVAVLVAVSMAITLAAARDRRFSIPDRSCRASRRRSGAPGAGGRARLPSARPRRTARARRPAERGGSARSCCSAPRARSRRARPLPARRRCALPRSGRGSRRCWSGCRCGGWWGRPPGGRALAAADRAGARAAGARGGRDARRRRRAEARQPCAATAAPAVARSGDLGVADHVAAVAVLVHVRGQLRVRLTVVALRVALCQRAVGA